MAEHEMKDVKQEEEIKRRKKTELIYDQVKQFTMAEDNQIEHVEPILVLQQSHGNRYVQRLAEESREATFDEDIIRRVEVQRGLGKSLEPQLRSEMETSFGEDFGAVRVHADIEADRLSQELGAEAFTTGKDVFFKEGAYHPDSGSGKKLLGHELAHVVQQHSGTVNVQHVLSDSRSSLESAANAAGKAAASGESVTLGPAANVLPIQLKKAGPEEEKGPPKTTKDPKEILGKVLEAASKTEEGKKMVAKLKGALTTEEGIAILSTLAVPILTIGFAEKMEVPKDAVDLVPKILKYEVGKDMEIALQPIYKGKLGEKPKEWGGMLILTIKNW